MYNTNGVRVGINSSFFDQTSDFVSNEVDIHLDGGTIGANVKVGSRRRLFHDGYRDVTVGVGASLEIAPELLSSSGKTTGSWSTVNFRREEKRVGRSFSLIS
jgi:hypothetical protein